MAKEYNLKERTLQFAKDIRAFVKGLPKSISNIEDSKQMIRSSGSIGANYIEANESLSKKDMILRLKISRKEAKETRYWLKLISTEEDKFTTRIEQLIDESTQLMNIFGAIIRKLENKM